MPAGYAGTVSGQRVPGGVVHTLPSDLRRALAANSEALAAWKDITPLARNEFICWVEDAKQEVTRKRRIRRTQEELEEGNVGRVAGRDASIASATAGNPARHGSLRVGSSRNTLPHGGGASRHRDALTALPHYHVIAENEDDELIYSDAFDLARRGRHSPLT